MSIYAIPDLLRHRAMSLGDLGEIWIANLDALLIDISNEWRLEIEAALSGGSR